MGINRVALLTDLFHYSYAGDFILGLRRKIQRSWNNSLTSHFDKKKKRCSFSKQFRVWWLCWTHLHHRTIIKWYNRYSYICFIFWLKSRNWRFGSIKTKLYDEQDDYNHLNLNVFFWEQHFYSFCIWSTCLPN